MSASLCAAGADEIAIERVQPGTDHASRQFGDFAPHRNLKPGSVVAPRFSPVPRSPVTSSTGACGDGGPDPGEECDDGNITDGDGCSATCTIESGFDCSPAAAGVFTENVVYDGSFELDDGSWNICGWVAGRCDASCAGANFAFDGEFWVWVGGTIDTPDSGSAIQSLVIPNNATDLTFQVLSQATGCGDSTLTVDIDGTTLWTFENQGHGECRTVGPPEYELVSLDIAAAGFADGGMHTITLTGDYVPAGGGASASWFFDDFRIDVPLVPPIPNTPSVCTEVICGDGRFPQYSAAGSEQCDDGNLMDGDGCSASCEIEQPDYVCEDPVPAAASGDDVADGGIENGRSNPDWTSTGTQFDPICSQALCGPALAEAGAFYAFFGGSDMPHDQTLTQDVVISNTATHLTFDLLVGVCDSASDSLTVEIDGTEIYRYDCTADTSEYVAQSVNLGAFADGGAHTLQFIGHTAAVNGGNSNFFVDNISIEDNIAFAGTPGVCTELNPACGIIEQFDSGIPVGWTVINTGHPADGWGASDDGICATENWSAEEPFNNVTRGGGRAACADSDATGQVDMDGGASAQEMITCLCTPALDLSQVTYPELSFLANYQAADNDLNDNGTGTDPSDDFDDDFLQILVGNAAPNAFTVQDYENLGDVPDHLDRTLALSEASPQSADLAFAQTSPSSVYACFNYRGTFAWFAQIDNAGLRGSACSAPPDDDNDTIPDYVDNCLFVPNSDQIDEDDDGIGNICDPDFDNDCIVTVCPGGFDDPSCESSGTDMGQMKQFFGSPGFFAPDIDLNSDGTIDSLDLDILQAYAGLPPGPSAIANVCEPSGLPDTDRDGHLDLLDPDDDNDGIGDALDDEPVTPSNNCTSGDDANAILQESSITTDLTCAASESVTVKDTTVLDPNGYARVISPRVVFESEFSSGRLEVTTANPCAGC